MFSDQLCLVGSCPEDSLCQWHQPNSVHTEGRRGPGIEIHSTERGLLCSVSFVTGNESVGLYSCKETADTKAHVSATFLFFIVWHLPNYHQRQLVFFDVHFYGLELAGPPTPPGVSEYGNEAGGRKRRVWKSSREFTDEWSMDGHSGRRCQKTERSHS